MLSRILGISLVGSALALAPAQAEAQARYYNVCSSGSFRACASAEVFWSGSDLVVKLWNMEVHDDYSDVFGGHHTIFAIGLSHLYGTVFPTATSLLAEYATGSGAQTLSNWTLGAGSIQAELGASTFRGHDQGAVGCHDPGPTSADHKATCTDGTSTSAADFDWASSPFLRFTFGGLDPATFELNDFAFEFHSAQVGPNNRYSVKAGSPPAEVVPEPATMLLMGTGLAGIAALRRRRERDEDG